MTETNAPLDPRLLEPDSCRRRQTEEIHPTEYKQAYRKWALVPQFSLRVPEQISQKPMLSASTYSSEYTEKKEKRRLPYLPKNNYAYQRIGLPISEYMEKYPMKFVAYKKAVAQKPTLNLGLLNLRPNTCYQINFPLIDRDIAKRCRPLPVIPLDSVVQKIHDPFHKKTSYMDDYKEPHSIEKEITEKYLPKRAPEECAEPPEMDLTKSEEFNFRKHMPQAEPEETLHIPLQPTTEYKREYKHRDMSMNCNSDNSPTPIPLDFFDSNFYTSDFDTTYLKDFCSENKGPTSKKERSDDVCPYLKQLMPAKPTTYTSDFHSYPEKSKKALCISPVRDTRAPFA